MKIKLSFALLLLSIAACKKDPNKVENPVVINEEELITTVQLTFSSATDTVRFSFTDPDGDGGINGITDTIKLATNSTYAVSVQFFDESNPANKIDITEEILEESMDHLVCFETNLGISIVKTDKDTNNLPIGLSSQWTVSNSGSGNLVLSLKHQPGEKTGSCEIGETDVEVSFPVVIN